MFLKIWQFPNPLTTNRDAIDCIVSPGETYTEVFKRLGLSENCEIWAGGKRIHFDQVVGHEVVSTTAKVEAETIAFFLLDAGLFLGYEYVIGTVAASILTSIGTSLISSAIFGSDRPSATEFKGEQSGNAFSVTGSGNRPRQYGSLPVVMGNHRFTPDLDCRPWVQFVDDPSNVREQTVFEETTEKSQGYACQGEAGNETECTLTGREAFPAWTLATSVSEWSEDSQYPGEFVRTSCYSTYAHDGSQVAQGLCDTMRYRQSDGKYLFPSSADRDVEANWKTWDESHPTITYMKKTTGAVSETTQELTQVFNFGLGDLTYSDLRLGQTEIANFTGVTLSYARFFQNWTELGLDSDHPNPPFGDWQANVIMVDGGTLRQNDGVENSGWVERDYYGDDCVFIQVDLSGRLYYQGNEGFENASCTFEIQYKLKSSATWTSRPNVTFSNADTFPVRQTIGWAVPEGRYEVRVRKVTADSDDARLQNDFEFPQVKFFRPEPYDATNPFSNHPAQNRIGLAVRATGQINGSIDDFNCNVSSKCWVYNGASWDGTYPGESANWSWANTENPAWWYLYTLMGIYRRSQLLNGHPLGGRGWVVGKELADGPRMFGAGIQNSRINFDSLVVWANFCTANNLKFNAVVTEQSSVQDLLNRISRIGRASPSWYSGKIGVIFEDPNAPVKMAFGMPSIIADSFSISYIGDQSPEEIVIGYIEPDDQWRENEVRREVPGFVLPNNETKLSLYGCKYKAQAQREANLMAARQFYQRRRVSFETTQKGLPIYRGDVITVAHDLFDWAYSGRVVNVTGNILKLAKNIEEPGTMTVQIQKPNGTIVNTTGTANGDELQVATTVNINEIPEAIPEDWIVYCGVSGPGKKMRVVSVDPTDGTRVKITCTDEDPAMWAAESSGVIGALPDSGQRIVAKAYNVSLEKDHCNATYTLKWELSGARMVDVQITRNGQTGTVRIHGDSISVGTVSGSFSATVTPVAELNAVRVEPATFTALL